MDVINFFRFIEDRRPEYTWEEVKNNLKDKGEEIPLEDEGGGYLDGKKNGVFVRYSENQYADLIFDDEDIKHVPYITKKVTYKNGSLNGPYTQYYSTNQPHLVGNYKGGNWDGEVKYYSPDGNVIRIVHYKNGIEHGKNTKYDNGVVTHETNYVDGYKDGEEINYYPSGQIESKITYKKGFKNGPYVIYYQNGDLQMTANYDGEKEKGITTLYGKNNKPYTTFNHETRERTMYDNDGNKIKIIKDKNN
jgi:antitoxin component YwqK of YwqJK toxin-antitoxin module